MRHFAAHDWQRAFAGTGFNANPHS
jgi:hypothetical protein